MVSGPGEGIAKALVTDGVLCTIYPFLIPPEGREDGGPWSALVDCFPLGISFLPAGETPFKT